MTSRDDLLKPFDLGENDLYVICWRDLDPTTANEELSRPTSWIDWLITRYKLDHKLIPPCWPQHSALVEELSALQHCGKPPTSKTQPPPAPSPSTATSTSPSADSANWPPASAAREQITAQSPEQGFASTTGAVSLP